MEKIYKEVADRLNIDKKEVELIYKDYIQHVRAEMLRNPTREIYFEQFGKLTPNIHKLKRKLKVAFKLRDAVRVKKFINIIRQLNHTKTNKHDN